MNQTAEEVSRHRPTHEIHVGIEYNGLHKKFEVSPSITVKALLDRAIAAFGNVPQPHTLALWNEKGVELANEQQTLKEAHVKDDDVLLLRPSTVKGG